MKKKILILGAKGMAGHMIALYLNDLDKYNLTLIAREKVGFSGGLSEAIDVETPQGLSRIKDLTNSGIYDTIINAVGLLIKDSNDSPSRAMYLNGYFPRVLGEAVKGTKTNLIHLSTDCVFDGKGYGNYTEDATPNETSPYGISKIAGEMKDFPNVLTLLTSIIGPEIKTNGSGLFHWLLTQKERFVTGYSRVLWNGVTTLELAKVISHFIEYPVEGLANFCPKYDITKAELLNIIAHRFDKPVYILEDCKVFSNKTLSSSRKDLNYVLPDNYHHMITELKEYMGKHPAIYGQYLYPWGII